MILQFHSLNDFYIVKSEDKNYVYFTFPAGNGDYQDLFDKLLKYSEYKNKKNGNNRCDRLRTEHNKKYI